MSGRLIAGVVLVVLGVGALLNQVTTFDFGSIISDWWPMLLVLVGVVQLVTRSAPLAGALVVIVAGLVLEAGALGLLPVDFWELFWPVILIAIGASLLLPRAMGHRASADSADSVSYFAAFGGREDRLASTSFQGGTITALFGGIELDLRDATLAAAGAAMDVTTAFGGVNIYVPPDWVVEISGMPLFGGWSNKTITHRTDATSPSKGDLVRKVLKIKAFVTFGGFEVKN